MYLSDQKVILRGFQSNGRHHWLQEMIFSTAVKSRLIQGFDHLFCFWCWRVYSCSSLCFSLLIQDIMNVTRLQLNRLIVYNAFCGLCRLGYFSCSTEFLWPSRCSRCRQISAISPYKIVYVLYGKVFQAWFSQNKNGRFIAVNPETQMFYSMKYLFNVLLSMCNWITSNWNFVVW